MTAQQARALKERIEALDGEGRFGEAQAAFETLAALDLDDDDIRLAFGEGACELAYELAATKRDRAAAEAVYDRLRQARERFPYDHDLIRLQAYAAAALSGLCDVERDFAAASEYGVAINRLNSDVPAELSEELDRLYGLAIANFVAALAEAGEWDVARRNAYSLRELLLSDDVLGAIAERRGVLHAAELGRLFETMVEAYRRLHPQEAAESDRAIAERKVAPVEEPVREARLRIDDRYDFQTLKEVTVYGFLSMRVPARWPEARADNGRGGFWEEDVESGSLWIDWDLFGLKKREAAPEEGIVRVAEEGETAVKYQRRETIENGEPLVIHHWTASLARGRRILLLHFNLVLLADLAERDDFRPLPDLIAREIRAARIDLDRIPAGAD